VFEDTRFEASWQSGIVILESTREKKRNRIYSISKRAMNRYVIKELPAISTLPFNDL
jgi:hypothetical protein